MNAIVDELRIWGSCLTLDELRAYCNQPIADVAAAESTDKLALYYQFNQSSGDVVDATSNGNTGTRTGFGPDGDAWSKSLGAFCLDLEAGEDITATYLTNYAAPFATASGTVNTSNSSRFLPLQQDTEQSNWTLSGTIVKGDVTTGAHVDMNKDYHLTVTTVWDGFASSLSDHSAYQDIVLPAGCYRFSVSHDPAKEFAASGCYLVAAAGVGLPTTAQLENEALAYAPLADEQLVFSLDSEQTVSLGLLINMSGSSCLTIESLKLERISGALVDASGEEVKDWTIDETTLVSDLSAYDLSSTCFALKYGPYADQEKFLSSSGAAAESFDATCVYQFVEDGSVDVEGTTYPTYVLLNADNGLYLNGHNSYTSALADAHHFVVANNTTPIADYANRTEFDDTWKALSLTEKLTAYDAVRQAGYDGQLLIFSKLTDDGTSVDYLIYDESYGGLQPYSDLNGWRVYVASDRSPQTVFATAAAALLGDVKADDFLRYQLGTDPGCVDPEARAASGQNVRELVGTAFELYEWALSQDSPEVYAALADTLAAASAALDSAGRLPMRPGFYLVRAFRSDEGYDLLHSDVDNSVWATKHATLPSAQELGMSFVWHIDESDGMEAFRLRSCDADAFVLGNESANNYASTSSTELGVFDIANSEGRTLTMTCDGQALHLGSNMRLVYWTDGSVNCRFELYEVPAFAISPSGYSTLYVDHAFVMPEGVDGGYVTDVGDKTPADGDTPASAPLTYNWTDYASGQVVPALTPLVLRAQTVPTTTTTYLYEKSSEAGAAPTGGTNYLHGALTTGEWADAADAAYYYKLCYGGANADQLGFWWGAEDGGSFQNYAGKAYLALPATLATTASLAGLVLEPGGEVNAVTAPKLPTSEQPAAIYTLSGVRVGASTTDGLPSGIYIVNGRKVIVK